MVITRGRPTAAFLCDAILFGKAGSAIVKAEIKNRVRKKALQ
jgi:hypothetical protein